MNEKDVLFDGNNKESNNDNQESFEIDYSEIEKSLYNALKRIEDEKALQDMHKSVDSDLVEFSSETDSDMLTGSVVAEPDSTAQQQTIYLLDIRNILLIFLLTYFVITIYSRLKNSLTRYFTSE